MRNFNQFNKRVLLQPLDGSPLLSGERLMGINSKILLRADVYQNPVGHIYHYILLKEHEAIIRDLMGQIYLENHLPKIPHVVN